MRNQWVVQECVEMNVHVYLLCSIFCEPQSCEPAIIIRVEYHQCHDHINIVEENYSESVTIVRRQRFEGGFHIRKKYSKK